MDKKIPLLVALFLIGSVSAYDPSIVNKTNRITDGSDLADRGLDTLGETFQRDSGADYGKWIILLLFTFVCILILNTLRLPFLWGGRR